MQSSLQIKHLQLFREDELLVRLNESVVGGEILTLMGPSGSGKSSVLNWLTGTLAAPFKTTGELWLNSQNLNAVPTHLRRLGVLYQEALLFSHLSVAGNIAFAMPKGNKKQRLEKVNHALEQVGLKDMGDRHPNNLSGGQQARVALLRMLLSEPKAILLDEPFSQLDSELRVDIRQLVFDQVRTYQVPAIMVTHDYSDAEAAKGRVITLKTQDEMHAR